MNETATLKRIDPAPRSMDQRAFVEKFGGVYEHFPEIAMRAFGNGLTPATDTPEGLAHAMAKVAAALDKPAKLQLIRNHPDLAGRLGVADLTASSRSEQSGAGLDRCTPEEFARFQELNDVYKRKFQFPFILAVAGKNRREILAAFESRLDNDRETEFRTALAEIDKIARIRLEALATPSYGTS
jgi:2-oxo-4-hydroxy-4-carboxy-5-ureidoimidazoline decarboxylase